MRKITNIALALVLILAPLVNFDSSINKKSSPNLVFFGSPTDDGCENETKDDDLPYYVNKYSGSDDNVGSENCPFATITKAAETIGNGDTVIISHGIYRESISLQDKDDVNFKAAEGDTVVIDGSRDIEDDLNGEWLDYQNGIYQTNVSEDAWQLFLDLEEMIPARWPNANFTDGSVFNKSISWAEGSMDSDKYKDDDGNWVYPYDNGELIDITGLNETGFDPTGAIAILNVGSFKTWSRNITHFDSFNNSFVYDEVSNWKTKHHYYFLEGKLDLIDSPGEWFFDNENNTLYFMPPEGVNPSEANIRAKTQAYGFSSEGGDRIQLENIGFFATTFRFENCDNCTVSGSHLLYPSTSKRSLNIAGEDVNERWVTRFDKSSGCIVENSAFLHTDGTAIEFHGAALQSHNNTIRNSYFYHIDWSASDIPGLMVTIMENGKDANFSNNIIHLTGASATISIGDAPTVMYNEIWNTGLLQSDGAVVQMMMAEQKDANIAYNWIHDTKKYGIRMDGPAGGTNEGRNATVHHNVLWNVSAGLMVKGDYHSTHNNTIFGEDYDKNNIIILYENEFGNENSLTEFNAADRIAAHRTGSFEDYPVQGGYNASNNYNGYVDDNGSVESQLIDPYNYDFRPKNASVIYNRSVGAYGPSDNWVAGITWYFMGPELPFEGCMDEGAKNYEQKALFSDGSCEYYVEGCMDPDAKNYNSTVEVDDGSCEYLVSEPIEGCTNETANNFNSTAEVDDGSCDFTEEKLDYCPAEITEENEDLVDDVCLVPSDETDESGNDDDEGFLPSLSLFVSILTIVIIAFRRR